MAAEPRDKVLVEQRKQSLETSSGCQQSLEITFSVNSADYNWADCQLETNIAYTIDIYGVASAAATRC